MLDGNLKIIYSYRRLKYFSKLDSTSCNQNSNAYHIHNIWLISLEFYDEADCCKYHN